MSRLKILLMLNYFLKMANIPEKGKAVRSKSTLVQGAMTVDNTKVGNDGECK